jgi:hypothetical protein
LPAVALTLAGAPGDVTVVPPTPELDPDPVPTELVTSVVNNEGAELPTILVFGTIPNRVIFTLIVTLDLFTPSFTKYDLNTCPRLFASN